MTHDETRTFMAILMSAYPKTEIGDGTIAVYARMLRDVPATEADEALEDILSQCKFFPTIAEIRQTVSERRLGLAADAAAWGEVMAQVRESGIYREPSWSSAVIAQAVHAVGWRNVCLCEESQLNTLRAQFERMYRAYRERAIQDDNLAPLDIAREPRPLRDWTNDDHWRERGMKPIGQIEPFAKDVS